MVDQLLTILIEIKRSTLQGVVIFHLHAEDKRTIILLHYFLDMSDLEISRLTHKQQTQVKKCRQRTLHDLREKMEDTDDKT